MTYPTSRSFVQYFHGLSVNYNDIEWPDGAEGKAIYFRASAKDLKGLRKRLVEDGDGDRYWRSKARNDISIQIAPEQVIPLLRDQHANDPAAYERAFDELHRRRATLILESKAMLNYSENQRYDAVLDPSDRERFEAKLSELRHA